MRVQRHRRSAEAFGAPGRRGAVAVEGAVVLGVFLLILFGMFDVGLAVMRQNTLSEAARRLARAAIVRGTMAPDSIGSWGPATVSGSAADGSPYAGAVRPILVAMDHDLVSFRIEWLDGDNGTTDRVRASVSFPHRPMVPFILGTAPLELSATSIMRIAH